MSVGASRSFDGAGAPSPHSLQDCEHAPVRVAHAQGHDNIFPLGRDLRRGPGRCYVTQKISCHAPTLIRKAPIWYGQAAVLSGSDW